MMLIGGIVILLITWGIALYQKIKYGDVGAAGGVTVAATMVVFFCIGVPIILMYSDASVGEIIGSQKHTYGIVSLKIDSAVSGSFFLGSGSVNSERQFYFLQGTKSSGYHIGSWPTAQSLIFTEKDCKPRIEINRIIRRIPWWVSPWTARITQKYYEGTAKIYLPEDFIVSEFKPL